MRNVRIALAPLVVLGFLCALPPLASAQVLPGWDLSVSGFGGGAIPIESDVNFSGSGASGTAHNVTFDNSASAGGKLTAWRTALRQATGGFDFGAEVDVTHSEPDISPQYLSGTVSLSGTPYGAGTRLLQRVEISSNLVALNLLARYPLGVSARFPNGWLQPYVGVGGGADIAHTSVAGLNDDDTAAVVQALVGEKLLLTRNIGIFFEYKFTHASHSFTLGGVTCKTDLNVNHIVGGVAFHF